jgi:spore coat protein A
MNRNTRYLRLATFIRITLLLTFAWGMPASVGSTKVPQTPLDASVIPKFVDPVPLFGPANPDPDFQRVGRSRITVRMQEFQQQILPTVDEFGMETGFPPTWVWGYKVGDAPHFYPGVTIEALRHRPTDVTYVNELVSYEDGGHVQGLLSVDQNIHWADPDGIMCAMNEILCPDPYTGPVPAVTHLHGAEVQSDFDGNPEQWFTPADDGRFGISYRSFQRMGNRSALSIGPYDDPTPGQAVYHYNNEQEATNLWFHDHTLGVTRLHVYGGLAAFYLIRDGRDNGKVNNPIGLPGGPYELEILVQDRQFDTNGQWYFPDGSGPGLNGTPPNPEIFPFWIPEFLGDAIVVNGKTWPYLNVEPRRYRFRFLNGSNARFFNVFFGYYEGPAAPPAGFVQEGPVFWQIGTDGGKLDAPVETPYLFLAPAERADVIVDFSNFAGQTLTLVNNANAPFPDGDPVDPHANGQIMQFRVGTESAVDNTCDPSLGECNLRIHPIVRLADAHISVKRQLTLVEEEGDGGPVMLMLNNSRWNGREYMIGDPIPDSQAVYGSGTAHATYATELPQVGTTEIWELVNISEDAHPIHLHLVQFQVLNRQGIYLGDPDDAEILPGYLDAYVRAFPGGTFLPEYGPPNDYLTLNDDDAIGGNPAVSPYLTGGIISPAPNELGWKDTIKAPPDMVTRIAVRFAPQDLPIVSVKPGLDLYPFDATAGPGYVWHCHILDHEDNEMMRPYAVQLRPVAVRQP